MAGKREYFNNFFNLYLEYNVLLNNTQAIFFSDIFSQLTPEEADFYNKSVKRIQEELEEDLLVLKESEDAKARAEQNFEEAIKLQEDLKIANDKLSTQNLEIVEKLKIEREFNKDFERIKAQNQLAAKFLYVVTFLIVCIVISTFFAIHSINEESITTVEKTNNIVAISGTMVNILKDLLLLMIGVLSTIFAQMFNVSKDQEKRVR